MQLHIQITIEKFVIDTVTLMSVNLGGFHLIYESYSHLIWFCIAAPRDWLKKLAPLCHPIGSQTKINRTPSYTFSRALCRLHGFALRFDWLSGSSV